MSNPLWLDDVHVGDKFRTDVYHLTTDAIMSSRRHGTLSRSTLAKNRRVTPSSRDSPPAAGRLRPSPCDCSSPRVCRWRPASSAPPLTSPGPPRPVPATTSTSSWKSPTCACPSRTPPAGSLPRPTTPSINTAMSDSAPRLDCWRSQGHTDPPSATSPGKGHDPPGYPSPVAGSARMGLRHVSYDAEN
jgi:hypothetical protein